jgi:hypothetical protein
MHGATDWCNCQRCGKPHCSDCVPSGCALPHCGITLPLAICPECRAAFSALDAAIPQSRGGAIYCDAHVLSPAPGASCAACESVWEGRRRLAIDAALALLEGERWHGEGGQRTNAAKAGAAALAAVPLMAMNTVKGILGGFATGAMAGAVGGALFAGAMGFDAVGRSDKRSAENAAAATKVAGLAKAAAATKAAAAAHAAAAAAGAGADGDGASPPAAAAPSAGTTAKTTAMMARAKAILRMSPEEQAADAVLELARMTACKSAYDVLEVGKDASREEISKAHKAKSMGYHPDKNSAEKAKDVAQAANNAYTLLNDAEKREKYDASGFSDTSGVDLSSGVSVEITTSRASTAGAAAAGILGGFAGLGLGAAVGLLGGAVGGVLSTVIQARAMSVDTLSAGTVVGERLAARRAGLRREEERAEAARGFGHVGGESLCPVVSMDATTGSMLIRMPSVAVGGGSLQVGAPLSLAPLRAFTMPELQVSDLEMVVDHKFVDSFARAAGTDEGERAFAHRFATTVGAMMVAKRKELGVPEPSAAIEEGSEGGDVSRHDATGMHGGETYEDRAAGATKISSAGGILSYALKTTHEQVDGQRAAAAFSDLSALGATYEAWSRGRDLPSQDWLMGRVLAIMGHEEGEGGGEEGKGKGKGARAMPKLITDPSKGWPADSYAALPPAPAPGPFLVIEVAAVQRPDLAAKGQKGPSASPSRDGAHIPRRDAGCGPWHTLSCTPAGEALASDTLTVRIPPPGLPMSLLAELPGGGGSAVAPAISLRFRVSLSPSPAAAEGVRATGAAPFAYGSRCTDVAFPREAIAALAGRQ